MRLFIIILVFAICLSGCNSQLDENQTYIIEGLTSECDSLQKRLESIESAPKMIKAKAMGGEYCKVIDILQQDPESDDQDAPYYVILAPTGFGVDMGWHMQSFRKSQAEQLSVGKIYFFDLSCSDVFEITNDEFINGRPNSSHNNRVIFSYDKFHEIDVEKDFDLDKTQSYWVLAE